MRYCTLGLLSLLLLSSTGCAEQPRKIVTPTPSALSASASPSAVASTAAPSPAASESGVGLEASGTPETSPSGTPGSKPPMRGEDPPPAPAASASGVPSGELPRRGLAPSGSRPQIARMQPQPDLDYKPIRALQSATGLKFLLPNPVKQEPNEDNQLRFSDKQGMFYSLCDATDVDAGYGEAIERLKDIDPQLAVPKFEQTTRGGISVKFAKGDLRKGDGTQQFLLYCYSSGGGRALRILILGKSARDDVRARSLVESVTKL